MKKCSVPRCPEKSDATLKDLEKTGWVVVRDGIAKGVPLIHCPAHKDLQPLFRM